MIEPYSPSLIWLIVLGFIIAFILAFGIGANDVANSFGTSVGSKVLTIFQACCLATLFEVAGAILIGYKVSDTMRKGILDVNLYKDDEIELMLGCLSALGSSAMWLMVATFFKLPISGTHSIVGATVGYSLVARGTEGLHWLTLGKIVGSWFISPVLSGCTSITFLLVIEKCILCKPNPLEAGLFALPLFYSFTILVNVFSIIHDGPKLLYMDNIPIWMAVTISVSIAIICMLFIWLFVVPVQRRRLEAEARSHKNGVNFNIGESSDTSPEGSPRKSNRHSANLERQLTVISENTELQAMENKLTAAKYIFPIQTADSKNGYTPAKETDVRSRPERPKDLKLVESAVDVNPVLSPSSSGVPLIMNKSTARMRGDQESCAIEEDLKDSENRGIARLFSFLQILTAMFGSFAHGGNDVSNAIGPLVTLWLIYTEGSVQQKSETPIYILLFGGFGISVGLWLWGRRVIQTIGEDLTTITPSTGFTIEIGAAFTVLLASKIGIPISTTHCKVGSVVFVGYFSRSKKGVDWSLFRNIIFAWMVTVPIAAILSAGIMFSLRWAILL
ncbi:hypothetical protein HHI36_005405 [Cryptolaemus montrouzieri]|uniref:Phosphate transporter n=1 Tax=Cryptolaemus montrouzieri TaxID=559131 RepID=A0ABD2NU16_9CUCU